MRRLIAVGLLMIGMMFSVAESAQAIPSADFRYTETSLGGGMWRYDYTLSNTSDSNLDAGLDIYDVLLTFDSAATLTAYTLPTEWDLYGGTGGFMEIFSLNPGVFPFGADVGPNTTLAGFSFDFDYRAGNLPFEVIFANPNDPNSPEIFLGTTAPDGAAPVPEPSTMLLVGAGIGGILFYRRRVKQS